MAPTYHEIFNCRNHPLQLELVKDYDCEILYHPGKTNCVADAFSKKSTTTIMSIRMMPEMLQKDIQEMDFEIISRQLPTLTLQPTISMELRRHKG